MKNVSLLLIVIAVLSVFSIRSVNAYDGTCEGVATGITGVSADRIHTCVLKSDGNVDCYGYNGYGESDDYLGGDAVSVAAGHAHTCVLQANGNVHCWGGNYAGQAEDYTLGDAVSVSVGNYHTCVLTSSGNVHCYGTNEWGQTIDYSGGDALVVSAGDYHTCILKTDGNVYCYGHNGYERAAGYSGGDAIDVASGNSHTCFLRSNGNVSCTGYNYYGQADDYTGGDAVGISVGEQSTCILKSDTTVECRGRNDHGQAINFTRGGAIGVAAGWYYACILTSDGNVTCYGDNTYGQAASYTGGDATCHVVFDSDSDGVPDDSDNCPNDPAKVDPGICGCGVSDADSDTDGTADCDDLCPVDPFKIAPGICGCNLIDADSDADGVADCDDLCANDPDKIAPGACGCGIPDTDSDSDGTADCVDHCPDDATKTDPGVCGCGVSDADTDGDGYRICEGDCDNENAAVSPAAVDDTCDGVDNDCDEVVDDDYVPVPTTCGVDLCSNEGAIDCIDGVKVDTCAVRPPTMVYYDGDLDGYGDPANSQEVCTLPAGYVFIGDDCDDSDPSTNPGASDMCDTGHNVINRDCNPGNDAELDCLDYCGDIDVDGYVTEGTWASWGGTIPSLICPWIVDRGDCNDQDAGTSPAAAEVCDDADNNCDGEIDEGCPAVHHKKALEIINKMHSDKDPVKKKITAARQAMEKSLGNRHPNGDKKIVWLKSDKLARKHGHKAYHYHKKAVKELKDLEEEIALQEQASQAKEHVKEGARKLAKKAIDEAPAGKDKQKAQEKYDRAANEPSYKRKIQRYKSAWKHVNKEKPEPSSCIDEISLLSPDGETVNAIGDNVDPKITVFTDTADNKVAINTSCKKCITSGQTINGWEVMEIIDDGTLGTVCSK